jgi:hypothetical protein
MEVVGLHDLLLKVIDFGDGPAAQGQKKEENMSPLALARGPSSSRRSVMVLAAAGSGDHRMGRARAVHRAGDKNILYRKLIAATIEWLIPVGKLWDWPVQPHLVSVSRGYPDVPIFRRSYRPGARGLGVRGPRYESGGRRADHRRHRDGRRAGRPAHRVEAHLAVAFPGLRDPLVVALPCVRVPDDIGQPPV